MVRLGPRSPSPSAAVPRPPTAATGGSATTPRRGPSGTNARSHSDRPRFQAPGASQRRSDRAYFSQSGPTGAAQGKAREPPPNPGRSRHRAAEPVGPRSDRCESQTDERLGLLQTVIGARGCTAAGCPTTRHEDLLSEPRSAARNVGFELGTRWSIPIEQRAVEAGTMTKQDASHWIAVIPTNRR